MKTQRTPVPSLLTLACLLAAAQATAQVNYGICAGTAYVASSPNASGDIVIASTFSGFPVTSIENYALYGTSLTSVTIGNSVTRIANFCVSPMHPADEPSPTPGFRRLPAAPA